MPVVSETLENRLTDLRYRLTGQRTPEPSVVLVAIDDRTLDGGSSASAQGRDRLARLIRNISDSGARTLAVDILLTEAGDPDTDDALAQALRAIPTFLASAARFEGAPDGATAGVLLPQPVFRQAAQIGLVNLSTDTGGIPRYIPLLLEAGGEIRPAMALAAVLSYSGEKASFDGGALQIGSRRLPLDAGFNLPLRHLGPSGTVPGISAADLLRGPQPDRLKDRLVVLGYTASGVGDRFPTPFDPSTPGVEIIATTVSQLLGGPGLWRDDTTRVWDAGHAVLLTAASMVALICLPLGAGAAVVAFLVAGSFAVITGLFATGIWMSAALPLICAVPPSLACGGLRYRTERRRAHRSEQAVRALRRFQSPMLADRIAREPDYLLRPVTRDMQVFFVDLTGFTTLSQKLGSEGTRALLSRFHSLVGEEIEGAGGSVLNYMGDGALAVFGLAETGEVHSADACIGAALALAQKLEAEDSFARTDGTPACRIGLHSGPVVLSRLGTDTHQQVTVSGDTVNLASRLMEVAKEERAAIVASGEFMQNVMTPPGAARSAQVRIRGREGTVQVHAWTVPDNHS
ncbi:CHASE2 domain-containing protein [uncultured Roseobacter sp.]|uniref:CHASE2 domain-containing protein n=1 Tax=uncultured Roseobacter sp. TaxID=114847 RepID=UPI002624B86A|nr:adenylate/guanylate cyclase domain-containing protein [uncultured Roseobacter sp.]